MNNLRSVIIKKNNMQQQWFKKVSFIYWPIHPLGWLVTVAALLFMVPVIMAIDRNSHSVSDELYEIYVYGTCTVFWWKWVADKTS